MSKKQARWWVLGLLCCFPACRGPRDEYVPHTPVPDVERVGPEETGAREFGPLDRSVRPWESTESEESCQLLDS